MFILTWFLSPIGKWVGIILLVSGLLFGAKLYINHTHNVKVQAEEAKRQLKVYKKDQKFKDLIRGWSDEEVAEWLRTGRMPAGK